MRRSNARTLDPNHNTTNGNMDSIKHQFRPNPPFRSSNLFTHRSPKHNTTNTRSNIILFTVIALILSLLWYLFIFSANNLNSVKKKYGIVIDGGSTGTRIHVFGYRIRNGVSEFDFGGEGWDSMRVNPGLSAYAAEPEGAGRSVADLVEFGRKKVPREYWKETEIRLMATAGMRLLEKEVQERILEACRSVLRSSQFKFRDDWASVISGSDEGVYAWVVANYALGTLGADPYQTTGIIELGGASAQVTFVSSEHIPPEFSHRIKFGNFSYNLYSHSLLQFGQNVAFDLLRESLGTRGLELGR
ncbi:unnamed protein product [Ilex paraguariensis]|uniref:Apyrase n=1 Tax=Ilex paraguariensis TaxID=185542 RepID=A0ABC8QUQ2_9AQUA